MNRLAPVLAADARATRDERPAPQPVTSNYAALGSAVPATAEVTTANAEVAPASGSVTPDNTPVAEAASQAAAEAGSGTAPAKHEETPPAHDAAPVVTASLGDPSEVVTETPSAAQPASDEARPNSNAPVDTTAVLDECFVVDTCVDRYLWALYQRTPKEDSAKSEEQRKVTVRRKGKLVTVTRTFSSVVAEDFSWKDPKAAEKAGMSMMDYVIGGMDHDFKMRLFRMLHAAEEAGLAPGITSAFRDDYRQSIASGLKAANDRSYHGGSFRGGYGHGLAADVVSVNGATRAERQASTETFWKWIDTHGPEFGIGRPYLDRDPPHVAPIDGQEYADHNPKARQAAAKARRGVAADHAAAKRAKVARSS